MFKLQTSLRDSDRGLNGDTASDPTSGWADPGETEGAASEVSVCEDKGEAEVVVVCEGVQVEEVAHINVLFTEAWIVCVTTAHLGCVVYLSTNNASVNYK